jgi:hypothetical protein
LERRFGEKVWREGLEILDGEKRWSEGMEIQGRPGKPVASGNQPLLQPGSSRSLGTAKGL